MARTAEQEAAVSRSRATGLAFFAVAVGAIAVAETALVLQDNPVPWGWTSALLPLGGCVYVATGLLAWVRRPRNRMGPLLCAGGFLWFASGAVNIDNPVLYGIGLVLRTAPIAFVVHALLAFPSGRLRSTVSQALTVAVYVVAVVLQPPCR